MRVGCSMRSEDELRARLMKLAEQIDTELDTGTNDPVQQWAALKTLHSMKVALEWVLEPPEVQP